MALMTSGFCDTSRASSSVGILISNQFASSGVSSIQPKASISLIAKSPIKTVTISSKIGSASTLTLSVSFIPGKLIPNNFSSRSITGWPKFGAELADLLDYSIFLARVHQIWRWKFK
ncbi:putative pentatricopeptide repeat-containing protein [Corchorus olitorius]|uniref:Pentatricopeptide repeat-containing protein n=1 Tax=Corchorus olitorius TaxID=93759 RepID=A0A1R3GBS1_9ROSI|nr:putative pentatricopeptide repeat-containing protein [Corchorus olitorius]